MLWSFAEANFRSDLGPPADTIRIGAYSLLALWSSVLTKITHAEVTWTNLKQRLPSSITERYCIRIKSDQGDPAPAIADPRCGARR